MPGEDGGAGWGEASTSRGTQEVAGEPPAGRWADAWNTDPLMASGGANLPTPASRT